ncbi:lysozyme [Methylobacterium phyllosphaerae]|uniref:Lysozyme n=1 Tax=Methylobacterium phyllosphaerae TaxID=418223 RepID=A0AAE8L6W8_9HYPH|nr:lysozyme [Methylobacterium phyllosphaerae]APT31938.1 lysozyme [Methylobacterium phyllosphaerae]SFH01230.1 lysozyme [Methylobacterium phyllosphaerae]
MPFRLFAKAAPAVAAALPKGAKSRLVAGSALAALACGTVTGFEGLRTTAYRDVVGIPTACVGETKGIRMGMTFTKPQCEAMLLQRLSEDFAPAVERCARQPMGDDLYAAHLSLAYNIGVGAYCKSSVVRLWNAGERRASCNAFMMWDKAGGRVVAGLVKRREAERAMCLKGV